MVPYKRMEIIYIEYTMGSHFHLVLFCNIFVPFVLFLAVICPWRNANTAKNKIARSEKLTLCYLWGYLHYRLGLWVGHGVVKDSTTRTVQPVSLQHLVGCPLQVEANSLPNVCLSHGRIVTIFSRP